MNRTVYIPPQHNDDFWTHDAPLFVGTFPSYQNDPRMVQARLHVSVEKFWYENHEIIPLNMKPGDAGKRTYVMMHPYILEPELFMTVGMYPKPKHYADQDKAIGEVLSTQVKGMRQHQIGSGQAWYYPQDKLILLLECFFDAQVRNVKSLAEDMYMQKLWRSFEQWLAEQFPDATRIATPFNDPIANSIEEYQSFLRSLDILGFSPPQARPRRERGKAIGALALDPSLESMFYLLYNFSEQMEKKGGSHGESDHDDQTELELSIAACRLPCGQSRSVQPCGGLLL